MHRPHLLRSLAAATHTLSIGRKLLVAPDLNYAREFLITLARHTGGWIGWEATTLKHLADELAFTTLNTRGRRIAGDLEIRALINRALEQVTVTGQSPQLSTLANGLGFRQTLHDSVLELRMAGVQAKELRAQTQPQAPAHEVAAVLAAYETLLQVSSMADPAHVFHVALEAFDSEAPYVLAGHIALVPSLLRYGLPGELLDRLLAYGAQPLEADLPVDVDIPARLIAGHLARTERQDSSPTISSQLAWLNAATIPTSGPSYTPDAVQTDIFAAATPSEELREVFRRVVAEELRWDAVEIVATDPDTYGIVFDALCQQLNVGGTLLHGIPLTRTRIGRVLERWFTWLEDGLPADTLRQALEAGELTISDTIPAATIARELRALQIGWGRSRYQAALTVLDNDARTISVPRHDDETDEEFLTRVAERRRAGHALAVLLHTLLDTLPPVPDRGSNRPVRTSAAALAAATQGWLSLVPVHGIAEQETIERIQQRLHQLAIEETETSFSTALATLRDALSDVRAWPLLTGDRSPWRSAGGKVHLTDVAHAGTTGRRRIFVVGLDADCTAGASAANPLLPDTVRQAITNRPLATTPQRREENTYLLLASLAALRGRVTLSYATTGTLDGREAGPSPILLQAWRLQQANATLSYEQLRTVLTPPVSAVPTQHGEELATTVLDPRDVWLDAIADGTLLLNGESLVRDCFPSLDAGLRATTLAAGESLTPYHGLVTRAAGALDPTANPDRPISPSALEQLAKCPLAWFYRYGVSIRPPQDPEYDSEQWLTAAERGSVLHDVFESFAKQYQNRQHDLTSDTARGDAIALADAVAERWREMVPPPSESVFESERTELRTAALTFMTMERHAIERGDAGRWHALEYAFGGHGPPGRYTLDDGTELALRGRVDRIDELPDRTLRVIDYKTGRPGRYSKRGKGPPFDGGRQLQPALYAAALETLLERSVARFEYYFPTERGENEIVAYTSDELRRARPIVTRLLGYVREGAFLPTTDAKDCGECDYQAICRAKQDDFKKAISPRAAWAKTNAEHIAAYETMLALRGHEEPT